MPCIFHLSALRRSYAHLMPPPLQSLQLACYTAMPTVHRRHLVMSAIFIIQALKMVRNIAHTGHPRPISHTSRINRWRYRSWPSNEMACFSSSVHLQLTSLFACVASFIRLGLVNLANAIVNKKKQNPCRRRCCFHRMNTILGQVLNPPHVSSAFMLERFVMKRMRRRSADRGTLMASQMWHSNTNASTFI